MTCPKCGRRLNVREGFDLNTYIVECPICDYSKTYTDKIIDILGVYSQKIFG